MKNFNSVNLCERCAKSDRCMTLRPCKDFAPEQSSNFLIEVGMQELTKIEPIYA